MDKIWKATYEFQDKEKPHPVKVFLTRGDRRWWVNSLGNYQSFHTYHEAEEYFDRLVESIQRTYGKLGGLQAPFEEFSANMRQECRHLAQLP